MRDFRRDFARLLVGGDARRGRYVAEVWRPNREAALRTLAGTAHTLALRLPTTFLDEVCALHGMLRHCAQA